MLTQFCVRLCRFGEDAAQDMVEWAEEHFPQTGGRILDGTDCPFPLLPLCSRHPFAPVSISKKDDFRMKTILTFDSSPAPDCESLHSRYTVGTGNGQLLFAFSAAGYTSLTGIDYSPLSIELANDILKARSAPESEHTIADPPPRFFVADILQVALGEKVQGVSDETWDLITDKGTYDAVCLSDEQREGKSLRELYVESIARLLPKGGIFLITSCKSRASWPDCPRSILRPAGSQAHRIVSSRSGNWTQAELEKAFVSSRTGASSQAWVHSAAKDLAFNLSFR